MSDFDLIRLIVTCLFPKYFSNLDLKLIKEHNLILGGTSCQNLGPR